MTSHRTDPTPGQEGPEAGAADNAQANAAPGLADEILGRHSHDGGPGAPVSLRSGAKGPLDPEDLVHARGQDVTPVTLERARQDLADEGAEAVLDELPDGGELLDRDPP